MSETWTIRSGTLLDADLGLRRADLRLSGGRIDEIAPVLDPAPRDLDATGLTVAPGFIDIHCHSEFAAFVYPLAESKVLAGVTTDVSGNCGASPFPLVGEFLERRRAEWRAHGLAIDWHSAAGYYARAASAPSSVNRALLAGHGALRAAVVGYAGRPATPDERRRMRRLLDEALQAGAFGLSSGLIYPPGCYADAEELADLARPVAEAGGYYASHIRSEGDRLLEAVDEFLEVVRSSGVRGQVSHLKASGPRNWPKAGQAIDRLRRARDEGLDVSADRYPYLASMTDLDSLLLPKWAVEGGREEELARLADPATRRRIADEIRKAHPEPDYFDRITVAAVHPDRPQDAVGKTLRELADLAGRDALQAAFDLLRDHQTQVNATYLSMSEENLRAILAEPYVAIGSDSSLRHLPPVFRLRPSGFAGQVAEATAGRPDAAAERAGLPHPRAYGTPARFLGTYVRDLGLMDWREGIRRLTRLPADIVGLKDRGRLAEGAWADLVIFDRDRIADRATYAHPWAAPDGIRHVFVNGERVVADGRHTGATPGRVLKREGT
ncbi:MAG TPA: D-aminoacylase [Phycisphaerae bacterium]|nr:D-aminoacylase [Phycisphaerae bacterium]